MKEKKTILFVDDDDLVRESTVGLLTALGYDALSAESGKKGIDLYKQKEDEIDLVMLDVVMPSMNGVETYQSLKQIDPGIKVLFASGFSIENQELKELLEGGGCSLINKPFNLKLLHETIQKVLTEDRFDYQFPKQKKGGV